MSIAPRTLLPAAALLISLALPTLTQAEDYDLVFDRPHEVGARYAVSGEAYINEEVHQRVNGETTEEQSSVSEVNMAGTLEVLVVNDAGGVSQFALTVGEYDIEINDEGIELQQDRRIIGGVEGGEATFRYENGDAIEGDLAELLDTLLDDFLDDHGDGGQSDEMMNLDGSKSPGDRWEMNHDYMVQQAIEDGELTLDPDQIESEVHFVGVNENNDFGIPMAVIEMSLRTEGFAFPTDGFPEWMEIKESYIELEAGGMLPIDPTSHQTRHENEFEMAFLATGEVPGQGVRVEVEVESNRGSALTVRELP
ncbi:hypothetical protein OT109_02970 [Phycisphaeraceae bacterium D3-23]